MAVVTELTIDGSGATRGAQEYESAMARAQNAMRSGLGAMATDIRGANDNIASFGRGIGSLLPSVGQLAVIAGAVTAAITAAGAVVVKFNSDLADMGAAARKSGLDIEDFQKKQFAAFSSGLDNKDFAKGAEDLTSRLRDASHEENDLSKLLDANNVKFKDGNTLLLDTSKTLDVARDLIFRAGDAFTKIKMAEMLGLTKEWVPYLDKTKEAFEASQQEASALGLVIDRETIAKAETFNQEWKKAGEVFSVWIKAKLSELLPYLDDLISGATEFSDKLSKGLTDYANSPQGQEAAARARRADLATQLASEALDEGKAAEAMDGVVIAGKALLGTLNDATKAALDQEIATRSLDKAWADFGDMYVDVQAKVAKDNVIPLPRPNPLSKADRTASSLPPKDDDDGGRDFFDRATESIEKHTLRLQADTLATGQSTAVQERLRSEFALLEAAKQADKDVTDEQIVAYTGFRATMSAQDALTAAHIKLNGDDADSFDRVTKAIEAATQANVKAKIDSQNSFNSKTAFLSPEEVQIAQQLKGLYDNDIPKALGSSEAAAMRLNTAFKQVGEIIQDTFSSFAKDIANGVNGVTAMYNAINKIGDKLMDQGFKDAWAALSDPTGIMAVKAAVELAVAAVLKLVNAQHEAAQAAAQAQHQIDISQQAVGDRAAQFSIGTLQAQQDGSFAKAQALLLTQQQVEMNAELRAEADDRLKGNKNAGDALVYLQQKQAAERLALQQQFDQQQIDADKATADARLQTQADFTAAFNTATGKDIFNSISDLVKQVATFQAAGVDPDQLSQFFAAAAQKLIDDTQTTGAAFDDLTAQFPDLIGKTHEYTQALTDQAAIQAKINSGASGVLDYINGLLSGQSSKLPPEQVLDNARLAYNANLAIAQGNPADQATMDAVSKFASLADNFEKASSAFNGSSVAYQNDRNQIISQGLALPTVQAADDPTVVALRDVLTAINAGNAVQALDSTLQGVIKSALDAGNAAAIAALLVPKFDALNTTADQGLDFSEFVAGLGQAGLAIDSTVAGLLTASQLVQQDLAKNPTLVNTNTQIGTLLTPAQLQAAGLAGDTTVAGLLTAGQLAQQNLSKEGGNLLAMFNSIAGGDGLISKTDLIKTATQGTQTATQATVTSVDQVALLQQAVQSATQAVAAFGSAGVLDSMKQISSNIDASTAALINYTQNNVNFNLGKILQDAHNIADNTAHYVLNGNDWLALGEPGVAATGKYVTGPGTSTSDSILMRVSNGEGILSAAATAAIGGRAAIDFINSHRALPSSNVIPFPSPVSFGGSNDNSEIRALRDQVAKLTEEVVRFRQDNNRVTSDAAGHVGGKVDGLKEEQTKTRRFVQSKSR